MREFRGAVLVFGDSFLLKFGGTLGCIAMASGWGYWAGLITEGHTNGVYGDPSLHQTDTMDSQHLALVQHHFAIPGPLTLCRL